MMSPLNAKRIIFNGQIGIDIQPSTETLDIPLDIHPKIVYVAEELRRLRHNSNKLPESVNQTPELRALARGAGRAIAHQSVPAVSPAMTFMPAFAMRNMPERPATETDSRPQVHQQQHQPPRRRAPTNNGYNGYRQRSMNSANGSPPHSNDQSRIKIQLSLLKDDVKLKTAENAWKPSMLQKRDPIAEDACEELYRGVRSILNKLTAQNFEVMLSQFKKLQIDTDDKLNGVIKLVFEKAVDEPNFSLGYAVLCKHLSQCMSQSESGTIVFKRTLISKCQHEFEENVAKNTTIQDALKPLQDKLAECTGKEAKQRDEIKQQILDEESKLRRRLVCTVRFIGELYKLDMLTTNIMNWCIKSLVESRTEEKLECLCKLLTTIGQRLETKPVDKSERELKRYLDLSVYFNQLKMIVDKKVPKLKISSRIRFMIMDVIQLRINNWQPKPKN